MLRSRSLLVALLAVSQLATPAIAGIVPNDPCMNCSHVTGHSVTLGFVGTGEPVVTVDLAHSTTRDGASAPCWNPPECANTMLWWGKPWMYYQGDMHQGWATLREDQISCNPGCGLAGIRTVHREFGNINPGSWGILMDAGLHNDAGSECSALCSWWEWIEVPTCDDLDGDGYNACVDQCDDDPERHPGREELCDGLDNDCDGQVDEDNDGDGWSACQGDCDDWDATVHPGAQELCDRKDNDCSGDLPSWETDGDGDGFAGCEGDCDESRGEVFPGAPELCDGLDNDCDDQVDEEVTCLLEETNLGPTKSCMISVGGPINVATGNMYLAPRTDLRIVGAVMSLDFSRTYNSRSTQDGPLGFGWTHSLNLRVETTAFGELVLWNEHGKAGVYREVAPGSYRGTTGEHDRILHQPGGDFTLVRGERSFRFSPAGRLEGILDPRENQWRLLYSAEGRLAGLEELLVGQTGPLRTVTLEHDGSGRLWRLYPPGTPTPIVEYGYDAAGNLATAAYADGTALHYHYEDPLDPHNLTRVTDGAGRLVEAHEYDAEDRAVTSYAEGNLGFVSVAYDQPGRSATTVTPAGTKTIAYDFVNGVAVGSSVAGGECGCDRTEIWDKSGFNLVESVDGRGVRTLYRDHDAWGHPRRVVRAAGTPQEQTWLYQYDGSGLVVEETDPAGRRTITTRRFGQVEKVELEVPGQPRVVRETWAYYGDGRPYFGAGFWIGYHPMTAGDPSSGLVAARSMEGEERYGNYNALGQPGYLVDLDGVRHEMTYSPTGRLLTRTNTATGATVAHTYDALGHPDTLTLPEGETLDFDHDVGGNLLSVTDALGNRIVYAYDEQGNRVLEERFDPAGTRRYVRSHAYDADGRLWKTVYADGAFEEFEYDPAGNLVRHWDPARTLTENAYDPLGRLERVTRAGAVVSEHAYNVLDQVASVTDGEGRTTSYEYDAFGFLTRVVSPDTGVTTYSEHETGFAYFGLPYRKVDNAGTEFSLGWQNVFGQTRLRSVVASVGGSVQEQLGFLFTPGGRVSESTYNWMSTYHGYDAAARLLWTVLRYSAEVGPEVRYGRDRADRVRTLTYPSGRVLTYDRDAAGNVSRVSGVKDGEQSVYADLVTYHPFGPPSGFVRGNGVAETVALDADYRVASIASSGGVLSRSYGYGLDRNVAAVADGVRPERSWSYGYDAQGRLSAAAGPTGTYSWSYDGAGNRLTQERDGARTDYVYEPGTSRLAGLSGAETATYGHDANGSVTSDGRFEYAYGALGRLKQAGGAQYRYAATGERVLATDPATGRARLFIHDEQGRLLGEYHGDNGAWIVEYVWLGERLLARIENEAEREPQQGHVLSKDPTYPSDERVYTKAEQLWVRIWSTEVDRTALQTRLLKLVSVSKPQYQMLVPLNDLGTGEHEGVFDLSGLDRRGGTQWLLTARIKDAHCRQYEAIETVYVYPSTANLEPRHRPGRGGGAEADLDGGLGAPGPGGLEDLRLAAFGELYEAVPEHLGDHPQLALAGLPEGWFVLAGKPQPGPVVTRVYPESGWMSQQNPATVIGENFSSLATARFGGSQATCTPGLSGGSYYLNCLTPPLGCGAADVTVTNPDGKSGTLAGGYLFMAPDPPPGPERDVVYYYHLDHLGTPQALTDEAGQVAWEALYEPFGLARAGGAGGSMIGLLERHRFPGQYEDPTTGLHQNWWRDYDPAIGRYLEADPIGTGGGLNLYAYVSGNPINRTDPFGLLSISAQFSPNIYGRCTWQYKVEFTSQGDVANAIAGVLVKLYSLYGSPSAAWAMLRAGGVASQFRKLGALGETVLADEAILEKLAGMGLKEGDYEQGAIRIEERDSKMAALRAAISQLSPVPYDVNLLISQAKTRYVKNRGIDVWGRCFCPLD